MPIPSLRRRLFLSLAFLLGAVTLSDAQSQQGQKTGEQQEAIRVKTELIELRAVVTDRRGEVVRGLRREEFEVLENGKAQEVSFFSMVEVGGEAAALPAERREEGARPAESPGRTVVLFVDTLHMSAQSLLRARQELRKFIDQKLTDRDMTAIVTSAGSLGVVEQFTRDRRILRYAVERLSPRAGSRASLFTPYLAAQVDRNDRDALEVAVNVYAAEERLDRNDPTIRQLVQARATQILSEATYLRRATLLTLREVVGRLSGMPGQRMIVAVSDGFTLLDQGGSTDTQDLQAVTSRATRSGVVIYSVDAKGLAPPAIFDAALGAMPLDPRISSFSSMGERELENGLNALARDTGGEAFFNNNDTAGAMGQALADNRIYYALAYYPAGEESEKKYRKITIRVRNHPEYTVRAQRGYVPAELAKRAEAEAARTPQQRFVDAILAPLPESTIGVTAMADYLESPEDKAQVSLLLHIDGATLTYKEEDGRFRFEAEVVTMVFNSDGKRVDLKAETVRGSLTAERMAVAKQNGLQYRRRIALKPGLHQIRAGVREVGSERMGTAAAWVEAADLNRKRPAMSSLILADALPELTAAPADSREPLLLSKVVQGIRYYRAGQSVIYFFRLYNAVEAETSLQIELLREDKSLLTLPWQPVASRMVGRDAKGQTLGGQLVLPKMPAGLYELRISLRNEKNKRTIQRSVPFGIEP